MLSSIEDKTFSRTDRLRGQEQGLQNMSLKTPPLALAISGGVNNTRLEAKAKDTKHPRPRTDPLEAMDRNARDQGPRTQVFSKKRSSKEFFWRFQKKALQKCFSGNLQLKKTKKVFANFPQSYWRFPTKFQRFKK